MCVRGGVQLCENECGHVRVCACVCMYGCVEEYMTNRFLPNSNLVIPGPGKLLKTIYTQTIHTHFK